MGHERTVGLNYEAEYNRLLDENKALRERMLSAEAKLKETYSEVEKLRAQMDVVHLIFGGK
jgi:hypothetical protein